METKEFKTLSREDLLSLKGGFSASVGSILSDSDDQYLLDNCSGIGNCASCKQGCSASCSDGCSASSKIPPISKETLGGKVIFP